MKNERKNKKTYFLRSLKISCVLLGCICLLFVGFSEVYEQMQIISFGEYKRAVVISSSYFRFFDILIWSNC